MPGPAIPPLFTGQMMPLLRKQVIETEHLAKENDWVKVVGKDGVTRTNILGRGSIACACQVFV